ncbi:TetR/AcrR family transcriptional regulator [uncultured Hymenobacter sp.]|uniref:TetR/AcrR family transcriptional regulator n=1 Tax=uncultured Hymenobacter sp. TaxID=170016 RepID=UPI0035CAA1E8
MEPKTRILLSAEKLFMRAGIRSVSMDDIAQELAISKKTLYKWFENKDQMVHAVMQSHLGREAGECEGLIKEATSAIDELFRMMDWLRAQFSDVHPGIFYDLQKYYPESWVLWTEHKHSYILRQISDNLHRGIREGLYRADLDVDVLARLRLAQIELAFNADVFPPRQFEVQRLQQAILEHFMLGVATLKGHKLINSYRHVIEEE